MSSAAGPVVNNVTGGNFVGGLAAKSVVGGLASLAGGGKFENGAVTAAFGYLFNEAALLTKKDGTFGHSALFIWNNGEPVIYDPVGTYSGALGDGTVGGVWTGASASVEAYIKFYKDQGYDIEVTWLNTSQADDAAMVKWLNEGPSGGAPGLCARSVSTCLQQAPLMDNLGTYWLPYSLKNGVEKYKLPLP